jgi:hypothetical protein
MGSSGQGVSRPRRKPGRPAALLLLALVTAYTGLGSVDQARATTWCGSQISRATWTRSSAGWTLSVFPSICGRASAWAKPHAAFNEAIRKGGGWAPNRASLYSQFVCHAWFGIRKGLWADWNLDAYRPNASFNEERHYGCNPPVPAPPSNPQAPSTTPAAPASTYSVYGTCADGTCGLTVRSGPGYSSFAALGSLSDGTSVAIACQASGETVGPSRATGVSSSIWDHLTSGGWVSDLYVTTPGAGSWTGGIPRC